MTAKNDITGDTIKTKSATQKYYDNWDAIFGQKNKKVAKEADEKSSEVVKPSDSCI